jgi:hypothetical protein
MKKNSLYSIYFLTVQSHQRDAEYTSNITIVIKDTYSRKVTMILTNIVILLCISKETGLGCSKNPKLHYSSKGPII